MITVTPSPPAAQIEITPRPDPLSLSALASVATIRARWLQALSPLPYKVRQIPGVMVGGIGWQGIVPSRAARMGSLAVDSVESHEHAHPAYARILTELAPDEARILRLLATEGAQPSVDLRATNLVGVTTPLIAPGLSMIGAQAGCQHRDRVPAYLNNLERLGLIWFSGEPIEEPAAYQVLETQPEVVAAIKRASRAKTVQRSIHLTPFGADFCRSACLWTRPRWNLFPRTSALASTATQRSGRSAMDYVNLGATGLRVSRVCLGMMSYGKHESREWTLDEAGADPIVRRAAEGQINFFDTADVYNGGQSEILTGRLLRKLFGMREEYVVATKVHGRTMPGENGQGLSRKHIMASIDASLARLELDYVDLYQIHRWDRRTPIEETMEALHDVVKAGKARYIGASSMFAWQFAKAQAVAARAGTTRFSSMQNHYNLVYREEEREMIPQCIDQGVAVIPWSPLARGMLTGNRTRSGDKLTKRAQTDAFGDALYKPEIDFDVVQRADEVAAARGVPSAQVALAWLLHRPGVTAPIVGATRLEHLEDALGAERLSLSGEEMQRLEELYRPHAIAGH
jgi:1-deoxyxylulose-5-phosphate synthase